ncbi:unnamed protein product [Owenia fusiformis]|uniref:Uncharacterized protein n=1 Tax=Owenia fusiformis TaxID=6347 RepID=A0A8J1UIB9_OWEFU|nr:unnamed protein product [Owenia fusiformis]
MGRKNAAKESPRKQVVGIDKNNVPVVNGAKEAQREFQDGNLAAELPWFESWFYIIAWSSIVAYMMWSVFLVSREHAEEFNYYDMEPGWWFMGGYRRDISNFEWEFWTGWFFEIYPWLIGHIIVARLTEYLCPNWRKYTFLLYGVVAVGIIIGSKPLVIILSHLIVIYLAAMTGSAVVVWIAAVLLLATLNHDQIGSWMKELYSDDPYQKQYYLLLFSLAICNLRYISFALIKCQQDGRQIQDGRQNQDGQPDDLESLWLLKTNFTDLLLYNFYIPLYFTGPILTYDLFQKQFNKPLKPWSKEKLLPILKDGARVVFWGIFYHISSHLLYINALHQKVTLMGQIPLWALVGTGVLHGVYFQVKYVPMFGIPANLSKFDQFDPPLGPKCVLRIYYYSDMWKYFDRGLYNFLKIHIYIPMGGSKKGVLRQLLGSIVCFSFIYYWHGAEKHLAIWAFLNFIGITIETLGKLFSKLQSVVQFRESHISKTMYRRIQALAIIPLWVMSIAAILYFFGGSRLGYLYFDRIILQGWPVTILTIYLGLYFAGQTAFDIERWEARKLKEKTQ